MIRRLRNLISRPAINASSSAETLTEQGLRRVRESLHTGLLYAFVILGFPVAVLVLVKWLPLGEWVAISLGLGFYLLAVLVALWRQHFSYRFRAIVGNVGFFLLACLALFYFGLSGPGFWFFIALCVTVALIDGLKAGVLTLLSSLGAIAVIGAFLSMGWADFNLANAQNSLSGRSWAIAITLFLMLTGSIVVAQAIVQTYLRNAIRDESRLRQQLELTNRLLREQLLDVRAARRESEEKDRQYRLLANHVSDIIWTATLDGRLTFVSPSAIRYHGYEPDELALFTWDAVLTEESVTRLAEIFREIRETTDPEPSRYRFVELDMVHKYGTVVPLEVSLVRTEDPVTGEVVVLGISRDISQRRRAEREHRKLEEQLLQAQKMEAIGQLAGGIAHDFNNLLTGITGNIELALIELSESSPTRGTLREASRAAERAAELVRQLLTFSRKQIIEPHPVDLNGLVEDLQRLLARLLNESIEVRLDLDSGADLIMADSGQIEQVILNLAINAKDAMPNGGLLTLQTRMCHLDEDFCAIHGGNPGNYMRLSVEDTGTGIDESILPHLFEPFFTTKAVGKGTGLGLPTVYGVVRQHEGLITVTTEVGKGSRFDIYLPVRNVPVPLRDKPASLRSIPKGSERILVVEDEPTVRDIAVRSLLRAGYEVSEAPNGKAALDLVRASSPFALMVTDLVMPGMSGRELAEALSDLSPETRVLYTSGYTEDEVSIKQIKDESVAFLPKPYTPQEIARRVRERLDAPG